MSSPWRILIAHNAYQQRGGEDAVVEEEVALLRSRGHAVELYQRDNHDLATLSPLSALQDSLWSRRTVREIRARIAAFQPDILHVHNTFPLISPAIYWIAARLNVPVVQTLHNFRLLCPQAMLLREGRVCEDCLGKIPWRAVQHGCYRTSRVQSLALAAQLTLHRSLGSYRRKVDSYIALNPFSRDVFLRAGLPADRVHVKPNFINDPQPTEQARAGFLFVGRLSAEKGISTVVDALRLGCAHIDFIGEGPLRDQLTDVAGASLLGWCEPGEIYRQMQRRSALVMPSLSYEGFPRTLAEAFACGLPVIASRLGSMAALIRDGETGLLFEAGNAQALSECLNWASRHPEAMLRMGRAARAEYLTHYTAEHNYVRLLDIYKQTITSKH